MLQLCRFLLLLCYFFMLLCCDYLVAVSLERVSPLRGLVVASSSPFDYRVWAVRGVRAASSLHLAMRFPRRSFPSSNGLPLAIMATFTYQRLLSGTFTTVADAAKHTNFGVATNTPMMIRVPGHTDTVCMFTLPVGSTPMSPHCPCPISHPRMSPTCMTVRW